MQKFIIPKHQKEKKNESTEKETNTRSKKGYLQYILFDTLRKYIYSLFVMYNSIRSREEFCPGMVVTLKQSYKIKH